MELWATGFNAWNQLQFDTSESGSPLDSEPHDIRVLTRILTDENIHHVQLFLSYTVVVSTPAGRRVAGSLPRGHEALRSADEDTNTTTSFAQASNGIVVVYDKITKAIHQHPSMHVLLTQDKNSTKNPATWSQTFPDHIIQLVSYETGFAALSSAGQVFTWGDERYTACLGRDVDDTSPATAPHPITLLESLPTGKITKIAAGGTVLAALTAGNDLYIWGQPPRTSPPASSGQPAPILGTLPLGNDPTPVDVDDWKDISDVAIGERHLIALTTEGELFVIGDNTNGQLGLPGVQYSTDVWTKIEIEGVGPGMSSSRIKSVAAGPRSSFVIVGNTSQTADT